jgi:CBS domain-containing protein
MAMLCPACGAKNLEGADECQRCGTDLRTLDLPKPASEVEQSVMHLPLTSLHMTQVHAVPPDAALDVAVQTLVRQKVDLVQVVDPATGQLLGVLSVRDIVTRAGSDYRAKLSQPVRNFMTPQVETLPPDAPITFALNRMDVGGYRHVPVVQGGQGAPGGPGGEGGRVMGVVSSRDVLAYIVKHSREQVATEGVTTSHGVR